MPQDFDPQPFAARLLDAWRTHEAVFLTADVALPQTVADAYRVQTTVMDALGPVGGFKTGTSPVDASEVIHAPVPTRNIRPSGSRYGAGEMRVIGIELEIGFRLDQPLPDTTRSDFAERLRSCVSVLPVLEAVDCRLAEIENPAPLAKLADNQFNFGLVLGDARPLSSEMDFETCVVRFRTTRETLGEGVRTVPGGNAFKTFAAFCQEVGTHCGGLKVGQVVTTGALTGLHFLESGVDVEGHITGLGAVSVSFDRP